jgi:hypothetical protein
MLSSFEHPQKPVQSDVLYFHGTPTGQARAGEPQALFRAELSYKPGTGEPILTQVSIEGFGLIDAVNGEHYVAQAPRYFQRACRNGGCARPIEPNAES